MNASSPRPEGLVVVYKPRGITSHDVVDGVRHILGTKKVGHAGTLDPMAEGVLVLGVGRATRLLRYLSGLDKEYEGTGLLGVETDTLDADGTVTHTAEVVVSRESCFCNCSCCRLMFACAVSKAFSESLPSA